MIFRLLVIILSLFFVTQSYASSSVQVLNFKDGGSDMVEVSSREVNIIRLPSSDTKIVTNAPYIDIKIMGENALLQFSGEPQPASLILLSKRGVYSVTVIPRGIPSATIVVKDDQSDKTESYNWEVSHAYIDALKELIKAMYNGIPPDGYKVEKINKQVTPLWDKTSLKHIERYYGASLIGDVYELKNLNNKQMIMKPNEFYTEGVLAVSVDNEIVNKGESTTVYIIKQNKASGQAGLFKAIKSPLLK